MNEYVQNVCLANVVINLVNIHIPHMEKETLHKAPVSFTSGALEKLREIMADEKVGDNLFLRVGIKGGGCAGLSYLLAFDARTDRDDEFTIGGLSVIMDRAHAMYVIGMEIDYEKGLNSRGFVFNNPNAGKTCGCGTSFDAK